MLWSKWGCDRQLAIDLVFFPWPTLAWLVDIPAALRKKGDES